MDLGGICGMCKHWQPGIGHPNGTQTCVAFPDGIPKEIWAGDDMHMSPVPGDNGVIFTPNDDVTPEQVEDWLDLKGRL